MGPEEALRSLGEDGPVEDVALYWAESKAAAGGGVPGILERTQIIETREWCGFGEDRDAALLEAAEIIAKNEALRRLAQHCAWRLFDCPESRELEEWPTFERALNEKRGLFYLLVTLGIVPRVRALHASMGISEEITRSTCLQVRCFCETYEAGHGGRPGMRRGHASWLRYYVREPYFRVGFLEYWLRANPCEPVVYRRRASGEVLALARDGERFTEEGTIDAEPELRAKGWESRLDVAGDRVTGTPISPFGAAVRREVTLPLDEWERVLGPGDTILQVHIPSGGKMTLETVGDSMRRAEAFFRKHFPGESPVAFCTTSWLFSNVLEKLLPRTANTLRFQRELYLFPVPSRANSGLYFIFPEDTFDPRTASRETALQRGVLELLSEGKRVRIGGMFLLPEDLKHFGTQRYRSMWPPSDVWRSSVDIRL